MFPLKDPLANKGIHNFKCFESVLIKMNVVKAIEDCGK
jgi:hypothetical protein